MENIENIPQDPAPEQKPQKVSPFADSPYVMEQPVQSECEACTCEEALPKKKKKRSFKGLKICLAILCVIALVAIGCRVTAYFVNRYWTYEYNELVAYMQQQFADLQEQIEDNSFTGQGNSVSGTPSVPDGLTPGQIHAQNKDSVVGIANQSISTNIFGQTTDTASSGSGFIISEDGYIVTNYHVIKGATTLTVIMNNEDEYPATVVGYDSSNDFALIKINATGLTPVALGDSDDLIVGDQVAAIGNPLGEMTNSLTVGYISVKDRNVTIDNSIINMLQTDAAISPGNSGGPLFNMKGEVIGITTAKYVDDAIEGIGFAIPINDVAGMIDELLEKGYISTPYVGVMITNEWDGVGVYVSSVEPDSPAAAAGLKKGDLIVGLGEYATTTLAELDKALRNFEPGDTTTVSVYRNRQVVELTITFGQKDTSPN